MLSRVQIISHRKPFPIWSCIAKRKSCTTQRGTVGDQSSEQAVDGNAFTRSATHWTKWPYWSVDLGHRCLIDAIRIVIGNLVQRCVNQLAVKCQPVFVASSDHQYRKLKKSTQNLLIPCGNFSPDIPAVYDVTLSCANNTLGRYVYVYLQHKAQLIVMEVEVYNGQCKYLKMIFQSWPFSYHTWYIPIRSSESVSVC